MTPKIHPVTFPRFNEAIMSERRTLFHVPVDDKTWAEGDRLYLLESNGYTGAHRKIGTLINVRQVRLLAELDADIGKLWTADRAAYLASWDALHQKLAYSADDPVVWRIEFRYDADPEPAPPEWSLAA